MTATKPQQQPFEFTHIDGGGVNGDIQQSNVDLEDDAELKQRKKEMILAKQLERRQQQEAIRQKREEERARKAEELRQKEEEAAMKKLVEKNRKETIFQAYIDKKKQLNDESLTNYFGYPNSSLLNAKSKFYSTQRLKTTTPKQQPQQQHFAFDLKHNLLMDQFDQASIISDRSTSTTQQQQPQMKSKSMFLLTFMFSTPAHFIFVLWSIYTIFGVVVGVVIQFLRVLWVLYYISPSPTKVFDIIIVCYIYFLLY